MSVEVKHEKVIKITEAKVMQNTVLTMSELYFSKFSISLKIL